MFECIYGLILAMVVCSKSYNRDCRFDPWSLGNDISTQNWAIMSIFISISILHRGAYLISKCHGHSVMDASDEWDLWKGGLGYCFKRLIFSSRTSNNLFLIAVIYKSLLSLKCLLTAPLPLLWWQCVCVCVCREVTAGIRDRPCLGLGKISSSWPPDLSYILPVTSSKTWYLIQIK